MATQSFGHESFVVVVGVDGSPESIAALETACEFAAVRPSSVVHAVHARRLDTTMLYTEWPTDLLEERRTLDELCLPYSRSARVPIVRYVVLDRPEAAILDLARKEKADLVVIGTRPRSGFQRLLLGLLTDLVVHAAPCPVLVVPQRGREARRATTPDEAQMRHAT